LKFFHACASQRCGASFLHCITDERGVLHSTHESVMEAFVNYFKRVLTTTSPSGLKICAEVLSKKVMDNMNQRLLYGVMEDEVNQAINQMGPLQSPGPDSFPAAFYQEQWPEVGLEVFSAIKQFFLDDSFDKDANYTYIALIPKKPNANKVLEFRPIRMCNVVYKILFKVLANRLKYILPNAKCVERLILAAYETLHTMQARMYGRVGYMAVKLDMSKAYDRVGWGFLEEVMRRMGFDNKWIYLVIQCVTIVSYSIIVNGSPSEIFYPSRGL
jgi:hypothetical protein